jgi:hypothetical protein
MKNKSFIILTSNLIVPNLVFFVIGDNLDSFVPCKDCQAILTIVSETEEYDSSRPKDT